MTHVTATRGKRLQGRVTGPFRQKNRAGVRGIWGCTVLGNLLRTLVALPSALLIACVIASGASAQSGEAADGPIHLGVGTCAASTCHGSVQPWQNSTVLQNEYTVWSTHDAHAGAYKALQSDRAVAIAARLGIGPAEKADICLDCHADNVAESRRGKNFDIADGVGCETCHGGAENWLGVHVSGVADRKQILAAGMYPTEDPVARGELCVGCHQANPDRLVSHRLMAAGHPRLSFELDTYSVNQPFHARIDEDYRLRKSPRDGANVWAIGQAVGAREQLAALAKSMRSDSHLFPELTFFECRSCHHAFEERRWQAQPGVGLGPGEPQLHDANLVMAAAIATSVDDGLAEQIRSGTRGLHLATRRGAGAVAAAAEDLAGTIRELETRLASRALDRDALRGVLAGIASERRVADYADYGAAEQVTMAAASILATLGSEGHEEALDALYEATRSPDGYRVGRFAGALSQLRDSLSK